MDLRNKQKNSTTVILLVRCNVSLAQPVRMASKKLKKLKYFYAPLEMISIFNGKRKLADMTLYPHASTDIYFDPPQFQLDSTDETTNTELYKNVQYCTLHA